jgi:formylglycine-generating enzyme required for sulfatase activity
MGFQETGAAIADSADYIGGAINNNSAVTYEGFRETNAAIAKSAGYIGNKISSVAAMLTSSLDNGFAALNYSLVKIDDGINTANTHLSNIHSGINNVNAGIQNVNKNLNVLGNIAGQGFAAVNKNLNVLGNIAGQGFTAVNNNLTVLRNAIGQGFSNLYTQLCMSNDLLNDLLTELKIPETQRERRYHVEEGAKYLAIALQNGDALYFEDAFDEFTKAKDIERKDYFSWFNLGIIYLRSKDHIDVSESVSAFKKFIHYAQAEVMHSKNYDIAYQIDDARLYIAESYYLQQKFSDAISETEQCIYTKDKAEFMKVKYLSAANEDNNKQAAAEILNRLIEKNPYITLQALEDDDILSNDFVIAALEKLRQSTHKKALSLFNETNEMYEDLKTRYGEYAGHDEHAELKKISVLLQKEPFLESLEAIPVLNELQQTLRKQWQVLIEQQELREKWQQILKQILANMVRVEGGTFRMGSTSGSLEGLVHSVTVKGFYMSKYNVTQKEWREVMGTNPSYFKGDNLPVEQVDWYMAVEYCNKLSRAEGLTPAYQGSGDNIVCDFNASGYRLPTEAEWEYAARGGNEGPMDYKYAGGNNVDSVAWYGGNSGNTTHQVGTKQPNSLGLYDMSGNVWEWCWDRYGDYSSDAQTDPTGASSGTSRVSRGGSWLDGAAYVRSANRDYATPSYRLNGLGFRLVRPQF